MMTPLVTGPSDLMSEYIGMWVDGQVIDEQAATERGYTVTVSEETVESSIPFAAEGGIRKVGPSVNSLMHATCLKMVLYTF